MAERYRLTSLDWPESGIKMKSPGHVRTFVAKSYTSILRGLQGFLLLSFEKVIIPIFIERPVRAALAYH